MPLQHTLYTSRIFCLRKCCHNGIYVIWRTGARQRASTLLIYRLIRIPFLLFFIVWIAGGPLGPPVAAQAPQISAPRPGAAVVRIPRVTQPPKIADFLNGVPREAGAAIQGFRQFNPGDGTPISQPTVAYLSYDDKSFYAVFVCKDDPGQVRAHYAKRKDIAEDDQVAVYLDTFHDRRRSYLFATNPLGIQLDAIYTEGQGYDFSFDTLWYSEGRLTPDGYIVKIAIPFKSLRFSGAPLQDWGIALNRTIVRTNEVAYWPYLTQRVQGLTQQFAAVEGLENISPGRHVQLIPYGLFARARFLDRATPQFRTDNEFRGGLDAKFVVRDALTFDLTLNPDFSQVESDEPQVTINQRFEVFFPEKRPFFIENAGFFQTSQTPNNLFFSRRIVEPQFGARMTGKVGHWALGWLLVDDRAPGKLLPVTDPHHGDRAGIGVVRVQREFASQSVVGIHVTSLDFAQSSNRVFSLDTRIKFNPNWVFVGQLAKSYTHTLAGNRFAGPIYSAGVGRSGRRFNYSGGYLDRSPKFHTDLGFVPRVDIRQMSHFASYFWRPEKGRVLAFGPSVFTLVNWDRLDRVQDWQVNPAFEFDFPGQTTFRVSRFEAFELFQNIGFRKHKSSISASTQWVKWLALNGDFNRGTSVNFFPASGPSFLANSQSASFGFTVRPSPRLRFDQTYIYSRLSTRAGSTPAPFTAGPSIFNNHILRSKLNYQFNRELSLRAIVDYNAVLPNPPLVALERAKRLTADLLLTYLLNPGTAFYVGYTDRYENLSLDPGAPPLLPPMLRRTASPDTATGRQFFFKLSYLFRF